MPFRSSCWRDRLPQNILAKHKNNPLQIEALLFGQAGFLEAEFLDGYPQTLKKEYGFLRKKYSLTPVENHLWKFLRMRPQNFPTIRLAQFAALDSQVEPSILQDTRHPRGKSAARTFYRYSASILIGRIITALMYPPNRNPKILGPASVDILLLNTLALFLFSYGKHLQLEYYISRSMKLLENLPKEENNVVADFDILGVKIATAFESQALLELKNNYCNFKKCLQCGIGNKILKLA